MPKGHLESVEMVVSEDPRPKSCGPKVWCGVEVRGTKKRRKTRRLETVDIVCQKEWETEDRQKLVTFRNHPLLFDPTLSPF